MAEYEFDNGLGFKEDLLDGHEGALNHLLTEVRPFLENTMLKRCNEDRSRSRAREIAADVIADCFGRKTKRKAPNAETSEPSVEDGEDDGVLELDRRKLLNLYNGSGKFTGWIITVGLSRLATFWSSGEKKYLVPESNLPCEDGDGGNWLENLASASPIGGLDDVEEELVSILASAIDYGFDQAPALAVIYLRLAFLEGVPQNRIADAWAIHPANISRRMQTGMEVIREASIGYLSSVDPMLRIEWQDMLAVCSKHPQILAGEDPDDA